jgi:6-pyruvoyltetrahydropterin/6-carboxytetrahydropterin synthase
MKRYTSIELFKENFKFSCGHFTIFSATERENMHGHNFQVLVRFTSEVLEHGMTFDYGQLKKKTEQLCETLNEHFLLPGTSPYLNIEKQAGFVTAHFNGEKIPFLARDVMILPIANVTLEELARWFLEQYLENKSEFESFGVQEIEVKAFSGPGQSASAIWKRTS